MALDQGSLRGRASRLCYYGWVQGDTRRGVFLTTKICGHGKLYSEIEDNGGVIQARHDFE